MKRKCLVLGNCQSVPLSFYLAQLTDEYDFIPYEVFKINDSERKELRHHLQGNPLILTQNIYDQCYSELVTTNLRKDIADVFSITNFYHYGLFPDTIYLHSGNNKIQSYLNDYNSYIVFDSFINLKTYEECLSRFNYQTYEKHDYFNRYAASSNELLKREEYVDIKYAVNFLEHLKEKPCLYTVNHPNDYIFICYAREILNFLDLKIKNSKWQIRGKDFLSYIQLPIFSEIAQKFGIQYIYNTQYIINGIKTDFDIYIKKSYSRYNEQYKSIIQYLINVPNDFIKNNANNTSAHISRLALIYLTDEQQKMFLFDKIDNIVKNGKFIGDNVLRLVYRQLLLMDK